MWKPLLSPLFLVSTLIFSANQLVEYHGVFIPLVHAYLDDLLVMPIFLSISLAFMRCVYNHPAGKLHPRQIIWGTAWIAVLFELVFPLYKSNHYPDPWDVLAYAIGAAVFWWYGRHHQLVKKTNQV
jgi:prepilin signal peptidase PulO-like enzyme (type II secretory pathway)